MDRGAVGESCIVLSYNDVWSRSESLSDGRSLSYHPAIAKRVHWTQKANPFCETSPLVTLSPLSIFAVSFAATQRSIQSIGNYLNCARVVLLFRAPPKHHTLQERMRQSVPVCEHGPWHVGPDAINELLDRIASLVSRTRHRRTLQNVRRDRSV